MALKEKIEGLAQAINTLGGIFPFSVSSSPSEKNLHYIGIQSSTLSQIGIEERIGSNGLTALISKEKETLDNPDLILAARLYAHNNGNDLGTLLFNIESTKGLSYEENKEKFPSREILSDLASSTLILNTMAYLSSEGDPEFAPRIPYVALEDLAKKANKNKKAEFSLEVKRETELYVPEVMALEQCMRNAKTNYKVRITESENYTIISIKDKGQGIDPDKLKFIFNDYTTKEKEGGLGLQVADRLMELKGGYIEVISKREGDNAFAYNTIEGITHELVVGSPFGHSKNRHGTEFRIYVPKTALLKEAA